MAPPRSPKNLSAREPLSVSRKVLLFEILVVVLCSAGSFLVGQWHQFHQLQAQRNEQITSLLKERQDHEDRLNKTSVHGQFGFSKGLESTQANNTGESALSHAIPTTSDISFTPLHILVHSAVMAHPLPRNVVLLLPDQSDVDTFQTLILSELSRYQTVKRLYVVLWGEQDPRDSKVLRAPIQSHGIQVKYLQQTELSKLTPQGLVDELSEIHLILAPGTQSINIISDQGKWNTLVHSVLPTWLQVLCHQKATRSHSSVGPTITRKNEWNGKPVNVTKYHHEHDPHGMMVLDLGSHDSPSSTWMHQRKMDLMDALSQPRCSTRFEAPENQQVSSTTTAAVDTAFDFSTKITPQKIQTFVVALPDATSQGYWHLNEAEWNLRIRRRRKDGLQLHHSLDSTWMSLFEYPSKYVERDYCRTKPDGHNCALGGSGLDPQIPRVSLDVLEVQQSKQGNHSGRGVFAQVDIPAETYIGIEHHAFYVMCPWTTTQLLMDFADVADVMDHALFQDWHESLFEYFDGYGFMGQTWGKMDYYVDSSLVTFANHGCRGEWNIGTPSSWHEGNLNVPKEYTASIAEMHQRLVPQATRQILWDHIPNEYLERGGATYQPVRTVFNKTGIVSNRDISQGAEILDNYMEYGGEVTGSIFWKNIRMLQSECSGLAGSVVQYQIHESQAIEDTPTGKTSTSNHTNSENVLSMKDGSNAEL